MSAPAPGEQTTEDFFLGEQIRLIQPRKGYRAGIDAALLAAAVGPLKPGATACEFGCGAGAALLSASVLEPGAAFTGVERDAEAAALARKNAALNGLEARVAVVEADALSWKEGRDFDAVFANPPWYDEAEITAPPEARRGAWLDEAGAGAWTRAALRALKPKGALAMIHRVEVLPAILGALEGAAGDVRIKPVATRPQRAANRIVVGAVKGARAPLQLLAPLVLHEADGGCGYTAEADAVLRGRARLALDR